MRELYVHITPRLSAALEMLRGYDTVADIGCDHGRLTAALLQNGISKHIVASDISEPSLDKAKRLIEHIGLSDQVSFRVGNGCEVLEPSECDVIALLGMGGTLMCRILNACNEPLAGAKAVVLQPMRAQADIRRYLYINHYHIVSDRIIRDHSRLYQIFKAVPGTEPDPVPDGFPQSFFDVGYRSFADKDELLPELCRIQMANHLKMLSKATGTEGEEILQNKINAIKRILSALKKGGTE